MPNAILKHTPHRLTTGMALLSIAVAVAGCSGLKAGVEPAETRAPGPAEARTAQPEAAQPEPTQPIVDQPKVYEMRYSETAIIRAPKTGDTITQLLMTRGLFAMTAGDGKREVTGDIRTLTSHPGTLIGVAPDRIELQSPAEKSVVSPPATGPVVVQYQIELQSRAGKPAVSPPATGPVVVQIEANHIAVRCPGMKDFYTVSNLAAHGFDDGDARATPEPLVSAIFELAYRGSDQSVPNRGYRITSKSGQVFEGKSDADGRTMRIYSCGQNDLRLDVLGF